MKKIHSTVALRMRVFFSLSNNVLPYNRACDEEVLANSSNLLSLLKVLTRVCRSSLNLGQWRKKCEVNSICKLDLNNLENYA